MIDRWTQRSEEAGVDQRRQDYLQAVVSTGEITAWIDFIVRVINLFP